MTGDLDLGWTPEPITVEMTFQDVNPEALALLTGGAIVTGGVIGTGANGESSLTVTHREEVPAEPQRPRRRWWGWFSPRQRRAVRRWRVEHAAWVAEGSPATREVETVIFIPRARVVPSETL